MAITFKDTAADTRTELGFGTASTLNVGTGANNIVQLDGSGNLPAVNGANLTGVAVTNTPAFLAKRSGSSYQPTNATWFNVGEILNSTEFDTDNGFDAANDGKYIVPESGVYQIMGHMNANMGNSQFNSAELILSVNGTTVAGTAHTESAEWGNEFTVCVQRIISLSANDYIQLSGYTIDTSGAAYLDSDRVFFSAFKIF